MSTPAVGLLDPLEVLVRLADELDRLDAAEDLDPAVRARAVARLCAVALAVHKQAGPFGVGERDAQGARGWPSLPCSRGRAPSTFNVRSS